MPRAGFWRGKLFRKRSDTLWWSRRLRVVSNRPSLRLHGVCGCADGLNCSSIPNTSPNQHVPHVNVTKAPIGTGPDVLLIVRHRVLLTTGMHVCRSMSQMYRIRLVIQPCLPVKNVSVMQGLFISPGPECTPCPSCTTPNSTATACVPATPCANLPGTWCDSSQPPNQECACDLVNGVLWTWNGHGCSAGGTCTPGTCPTGNVCGPDTCGNANGCGTCPSGETCSSGQCVCSCGSQDCGNNACGVSCGTCPFGTCVSGRCACTPSCPGHNVENLTAAEAFAPVLMAKSVILKLTNVALQAVPVHNVENLTAAEGLAAVPAVKSVIPVLIYVAQHHQAHVIM